MHMHTHFMYITQKLLTHIHNISTYTHMYVHVHYIHIYANTTHTPTHINTHYIYIYTIYSNTTHVYINIL